MKRNDSGSVARYLWPLCLCLILVLASCSSTATATGATSPEPLPSATRTARPPEATAAQAPSTRPPEAAAIPRPSSRATPLPLAPGSGALPARLAQIPLAPEGQVLGDLVVDAEKGRLYVTDSTGTLHVVDGATFEELASLPVTGSWEPIYGVRESLILDAAHERLYVQAETRPDGVVTVVDTAALAVVGSVSPGGSMSLDSRRHRLYVGRPEADNPVYDSSYAGLLRANGKVYDAQTLEELGDLPVSGRPVYDPLADELLVVSFTVYRVDPDTLQVTGDLLPDVSAEPCPRCNGTSSASGARVDADRNVLTVYMRVYSAGHPAPCTPNDRCFDATTLEPIADSGLTPPLEPTCNERRQMPASVRERAYMTPQCQDRVLVYSLDGEPITALDGMTLGLVNPNTCQSYTQVGDQVVVLDLPALTPVGALPLAEYTLDPQAGRLYGLAGGDLLVFDDQGGQAELQPPEASALPAAPITLIRPSPDYAHDGTLFVGVAMGTTYPFNIYNSLYRSTDGGQSWVLLRGGLPQGDFVGWDLAISPGFAEDQTLFAGGTRAVASGGGPYGTTGLGVFRSTDGGDTWQPSSSGLLDLRVDKLVLSPDYSRDGTLLVYTHPGSAPGATNQSVYRSTDRGEHWTLVSSGSPPTLVDLLPPGSKVPPAQFRLAVNLPAGVDRRTADTRTWRQVFRTELDADRPVAVLPSPAIETDSTVYLLTQAGLLRSIDLGETWQRCPNERLDGRAYDRWVAGGALAGDLLLVGTRAGEFFFLDVTEQLCEPSGTTPVWPTVLSGQRVNRIESAPVDWAGPGSGGDVWLGTAGSGVYRYAGGAIQDHYAAPGDLRSQDIWGLALAPAPPADASPGGTLWVSGQDPLGIASFDGQTWSAHTPELPGLYPWVVDLAAGADGSLWAIAMWSTGGGQPEGALLRWTGSEWQCIDDPEGHLGSSVYDVDVASDGAVWVATIDGLARYSQGLWASFDRGECGAVAPGPGGEAYTVNAAGELWRYTGAGWTALPPPPTGPPGFRALHVTRDGAVWIATMDGVARYDGLAWRHFTAADGLPGAPVACIAEDAAGLLWFGTNSGAVLVDPATLDLSPVSRSP